MRSEELFDTGRPKGCFSRTQHRMTSGSYTENLEKKQRQFKKWEVHAGFRFGRKNMTKLIYSRD